MKACKRCSKEIAQSIAKTTKLKDMKRISVCYKCIKDLMIPHVVYGYTKTGFQVWCANHDEIVVNINLQNMPSEQIDTFFKIEPDWIPFK